MAPRRMVTSAFSAFYQEAELWGERTGKFSNGRKQLDAKIWQQRISRADATPPRPIERNFWQPSHFFNIPNREFSFRPRGNKKM